MPSTSTTRLVYETAVQAAQEVSSINPPGGILSSRARRFWGALVDVLLLLLAGSVPVLLAWRNGSLDWQDPQLEHWLGIQILVAQLPVHAIQAGLITWRAQSVGKLITGTRIITADGSAASFLQGVLLRSWLPGIAGLFAGCLLLADALLIYRPDRRCIHDLVANTQVVDYR